MGKPVSSPATIYLLRHAHAAWAHPGQRDFGRQLDDRGREDADLVGRALARLPQQPEVVLCSTAVRCRQTSEIVVSHMQKTPEIHYINALYNDDHRLYVDLLSQQTAFPTMLVGHNPMMEDTLRTLCATASEDAAERLRKGYPTAGLAVLRFQGATPDIRSGGHMEEFLYPKRLRKKARKVHS
ncbi:SixA phosphatase family protein [Hoeflea prorocentri]|uniref:Histidine phosphatase family protein n=1 Tax=Hoeflea prorocentri TaxID=1922333 RepID=A0A9X3UGB9_9HYPH|nr:histidine phosphatase family protein [Hoeflea prorocentri]MCY6380335.1 histidine phosphatase family protein [Hoeflea prorocentri]MDA5398135.1 histidine phosphatase family protein [Hoeflea prorocentri]